MKHAPPLVKIAHTQQCGDIEYKILLQDQQCNYFRGGDVVDDFKSPRALVTSSGPGFVKIIGLDYNSIDLKQHYLPNEFLHIAYTILSFKPTTMKKAPVKKQKVIGSKSKPQKVIGSKISVPPLTAKQKKVLQSPPKPPMKRIIVAPAPTKPRTLATFSSIPELKKTLLKKSTTAKLYLMYNKITKQYWWRSVGLNGEILANSEQMHNKADVKHNAALHFDLF